MGKGHAMLVGEGGSGRHSLSQLASYIAKYETFQINIKKGYGKNEFKEDIMKVSRKWGKKNKSGVFLFSDTQIINPSFLEDVNSILSTGEVPNLFAKEIKTGIIQSIEKKVKKKLELKIVTDEIIWDYFKTSLKTNFHVVFCMSQTGENLRKYTRMYPGLVNNTTTIWFQRWPTAALKEVAQFFLKDITFEEDILKEKQRLEEEAKQKAKEKAD